MKKINDCLNNTLKTICKKSIEIEKLNHLVKQYLPENLRDHCYVGSFNQGCLHLMSSDAVWASQLRYYQTTLRDALRSQGGVYQLSAVKISICDPQTRFGHPTNSPVRKAELSTQAKEVIRGLSKSCQHDPLKKALERIVR